jgi:hypothetical protein
VRNEVTRITALVISLGIASGCTRADVAEIAKSDTTPSEAAHPTIWSVTSHKLGSIDRGTTEQQPDAGGAVAITPTPVGPTPGTDVPNSQLDPGPSDPIVVEPPPLVVEEPAPVVTPKATLVFNESASTHTGPAPQQFSVHSVRELFIHSVWSDLTGEHTETRKFYSPSGELYYEKLTPFSTEIDAPVPYERPVSIPHASSIQATPLDTNGNVIVTDYLSVGGTWISDRSMTGIWTVEIYLDDATKPSLTSDLELVP